MVEVDKAVVNRPKSAMGVSNSKMMPAAVVQKCDEVKRVGTKQTASRALEPRPATATGLRHSTKKVMQASPKKRTPIKNEVRVQEAHHEKPLTSEEKLSASTKKQEILNICT